MRRLAPFVVAAAALAAVCVPSAQAGPPGEPADTATGHLEEVLARSPAPEYRRYGSKGMVEVAKYARRVLRDAGYAVIDREVPANRWRIAYGEHESPLLERVSDGTRYHAESAFDLGAVTGPEGITCVVRRYDRVRPGECGFVPFELASPEWNNPSADPRGAVATIVDRGGIGAVIQGDTARDAVIALEVTDAVPVVVAVVEEADVLGHDVRLRAIGAWEPAVTHDVVAVRRPADPSRGYVMLLAHSDGFFTAAVDNGTGVAAALRAAQLLSFNPPAGAGVVVALVDGEEVGYHGSKALASAMVGPGIDPGDGGPPVGMEHLETVLNLDASSARPSDVQQPLGGAGPVVPTPLFSWRVLVATEHPDVAAQFVSTFFAHGVLGLPIPVEAANELNGGITRTDARWFARDGIAVVWPVAGYPEYHTSADDLDAVDPADLEALARASAVFVRRVGA